MTGILFRLTLVFFLSLFAFTAQTTGIYIGTSSSAAGETASSWESFSLDGSTSLRESQVLGLGSISTNRQTEGNGNNSLKQTLSGSGYVIENNIETRGKFSAFTDSSASAQSAALNQNVGGIGDLSLELQGKEGVEDAVQQAKVEGGLLNSQHSLSAGEGITASQNTLIEGQKGSILAGALGKDNVMVASGEFEGIGSMKATLESTSKNRASATGTAYIDDAPVLNDNTFKAIHSAGKSQGMGVSGLRMIEGGLGDFDVSVVNLDWASGEGSSYASEDEVDDSAKPRGSSSSYALTGYRWNQEDPDIQLYLNPTDIPAGIKVQSAQNAITYAADTWDEAVEQSLFIDGSTVIVDDGKQVINPLSAEYMPDGFNLNGFKNLDNDYLALTAFWTDLSEKDGYYSIVESDIVYNLDFKWTDDEKQAKNTGKLDLQSVALHELGHTIGMGDLYNLENGDERKQDYAQVMNLYDGPQRTLGNGDLAGVQKMYGVPDSESHLQSKIGVLRDGAWYLDYNGNGNWDQDDTLSFFGTDGDLPAIGDWNGDGKNKIGVLRNGEWYLDYNGNGIWDSEDIVSSSFALTGDLPVIGDWSGDGKDKIGVLRNGEWYLDYNGNGFWDPEDIFSNGFGMNGDLPVAGDWNGDGKDKIGVLRNGEWYFDYNGNGIWDSEDMVSFFGTEGDRPITNIGFEYLF